MDIDGDGRRDILSGSYSRQGRDMAGLFQVLYGQADGTFRTAEVLKGTDGEPLLLPGGEGKEYTDQIVEKICTRPFAVDWDGDGHLDLVVGNFAGRFHWFKGKGKGKFRPKPEAIWAGGKPLQLPADGVHGDPFVVDWDGDGDLDLVSGSSDGGVYWAENTAGKGKPPELTAFKPLVPPDKSPPREGKPLREGDLTRPTYGVRVWVADFDGDGKLDLLVGDGVTLVSPAKGLTDEEMGKRHADWSKEFAAAMTVYQEAQKGKDTEAIKKAAEGYQKLYEKQKEFMTEEMTGYVWLYRRK